jgi:glycosyl transferase family 87
LSKSERILFWCFSAVALVLRALAFFRYRFDSDEQQHLHVAWAWTKGLVQYRDLFDNHLPLFHLVTAPMVALVGERADILLWMRLPMLALFGVVIWATYVLADDARVGRWAVVLLALFPPFFLKSLEFRNDNLWTALWMLAMVGVVRRWRPFVIGLLLGGALMTSIKTVVLLVAFVIALRKQKWMEMLAGFVVVPALVTIYFASIGALDELLYCNFTFNAQFAAARKGLWVLRVLFPILLGLILWLARHYRPHFFAVLIAVHAITLVAIGSPISPREFLPLMPLAAILLATSLQQTRAFAAIAIVFVAALFYYADRFENNTDWHITMMHQVLGLSKPGEYLLDVKGETIFRRRPFYYVFENLTRAQMAHGIIRDTVAEGVIRTRTHVVQADGPMWPPRARAFLSENFLDMGRLRASGQWIHKDGSFTIAVPGEYMFVDESGPLTRPRVLTAGTHQFMPVQRLTAVVWAPAIRRGYSPFKLKDREF